MPKAPKKPAATNAKRVPAKKSAATKVASQKVAAKKVAAKKPAAKKPAAKKGAAKVASTGAAPKRPAMKKMSAPAEQASGLIDQRIASLGDWRGPLLAQLRDLIRKADRRVVEEWKWSVPVWSHAGIICTGETYKSAVKLTFAKGAALPDPAGIFNSSLEGNTRRAIDFKEGAKVDAKALQALIRAAADLNES